MRTKAELLNSNIDENDRKMLFKLKNLQGNSPAITEFEGVPIHPVKWAYFRHFRYDEDGTEINSFDALSVIAVKRDGEEVGFCTSSNSYIDDFIDICDFMDDDDYIIAESHKSKNNEGKYYRAVVLC